MVVLIFVAAAAAYIILVYSHCDYCKISSFSLLNSSAWYDEVMFLLTIVMMNNECYNILQVYLRCKQADVL